MITTNLSALRNHQDDEFVMIVQYLISSKLQTLINNAIKEENIELFLEGLEVSVKESILFSIDQYGGGNHVYLLFSILLSAYIVVYTYGIVPPMISSAKRIHGMGKDITSVGSRLLTHTDNEVSLEKVVVSNTFQESAKKMHSLFGKKMRIADLASLSKATLLLRNKFRNGIRFKELEMDDVLLCGKCLSTFIKFVHPEFYITTHALQAISIVEHTIWTSDMAKTLFKDLESGLHLLEGGMKKQKKPQRNTRKKRRYLSYSSQFNKSQREKVSTGR